MSSRLDVAHHISCSIGSKLIDFTALAGNIWAALDHGLFDCESGRVMGVAAMMILCVNQSNLQWTFEQGCHAYPSIDTITGPGYYSDCTTQDKRPGDHEEIWTLVLGSNGPTENFFKIQSDTGYWFYKTVAPWLDYTIVGSETKYDDLDKHGRYMILYLLGFEQYWRRTNPDTGKWEFESAPPLPHPPF